jgi:Na+/melibiose symporter-like transporter
LEPAVYNIGVRFDKNAKVKSLQDVMVDEPSTLTLDYRSRASLRGVGGALLAIGASLGAICAVYMLAEENPNKPLGYLGLTTGVAGAIVGISFMTVGDKVVLTVK